MRLGQGISFLSQWENSGGGRDGGDQRQVGVPVESGLGGPTQKSASPCGTRGLGSIESSNDVVFAHSQYICFKLARATFIPGRRP